MHSWLGRAGPCELQSFWLPGSVLVTVAPSCLSRVQKQPEGLPLLGGTHTVSHAFVSVRDGVQGIKATNCWLLFSGIRKGPKAVDTEEDSSEEGEALLLTLGSNAGHRFVLFTV